MLLNGIYLHKTDSDSLSHSHTLKYTFPVDITNNVCAKKQETKFWRPHILCVCGEIYEMQLMASFSGNKHVISTWIIIHLLD